MQAKISLYFLHAPPKLRELVMEHDLNLWGIFAMPVGVLLCFGPALLSWIRAELAAPKPAERERKR